MVRRAINEFAGTPLGDDAVSGIANFYKAAILREQCNAFAANRQRHTTPTTTLRRRNRMGYDSATQLHDFAVVLRDDREVFARRSDGNAVLC